MSQKSEVQLVELRDLEAVDPARYQRLFEDFVALYRTEFTDPSERENPAAWHARLQDAAAPEPRMYITLACSAELAQPSRVLGGIAYEYYRESRCALVTYLLVSQQARHKGHGARLLAAARERLQRDAGTDDTPHAIFAEAEIPDRLADAVPRQAARQRLAILAALGARKVAVEYVQPELQAGNGRARHLMLLQLPGHAYPLTAHDLGAFLSELYRSLGIARPEQDADYRISVRGLADRVATLRLEAPVLKLEHASLCLHHIVRDASPLLPDQGEPLEPCPIIGSMERDLLSLSYQDNPELVTYCHSHGEQHDPTDIDYAELVEVEFPEVTTYYSEGRVEQRYCGSTRRALRVYLSQTIFPEARLSIWHVTLRPAPGEWLDELDLIKLIHLYDGRTESTGLHQRIVFHAGRERIGGVEALLRHTAKRWHCDPKASTRPSAGTIQLVDPTIASDAVSSQLFGAAWLYPAADPAREQRCQEIARQVEQRGAVGRRLLALCGIITGIFDFEQIDGGEALDTLVPTYAHHGVFARIDRRTLLQISSADRSLQTVLTTVGVSPYLIIPHALLIFDDHLTQQAHAAAEVVLRESAPSLAALESAREEMNRNLRGLWLSNVFNYGTERALFSSGQEARGTNDRYRLLHARLMEIEGSLSQAWERRRQLSESLISVLLALISIVTFILGPLIEVLKWLWPSPNAERTRVAFESVILLVFLVVVAFASLRGIRDLRDRRRARAAKRAAGRGHLR
jgi:hypothetical protein